MAIAQFTIPSHAKVDLTSCDLEPIHQISAIQRVGFLLAVSSDWLIVRLSENANEFLRHSIDCLLHIPLSDLLLEEAIHTIRNRVTMLRNPDEVERVFAIMLQNGGVLFDLSIHVSETTIVIEAERSQPSGGLNSGAMVRSMMSRMRGQTSLVREAARLVQGLTGFDRVMIYRFHADDSGEVIAERVRGDLEPFLGLRYPAEDIPAQARALLIRNPVRLLADVNGVPSLLVPQVNADGFLDLSMSTLRAHSIMHIEFLKNMGVAATMTVSLVRDGRLWGLISCHHMSPKHVGFEQRTTVELFGQLLSLLIAEEEQADFTKYAVRMRELHGRLSAGLLEHGSPEQKIVDIAEHLRDLVPFDGLAVCIGGNVILRGITPTREELAELRFVIDRTTTNQVFATDCLGKFYEPAMDFVERAAGMMVVPISRSPLDFLVFFRREIALSIVWAGRPGKIITYGPNGSRLAPRKSFEAWQELVHGHSKLWTAAELHASEYLRVALLEAMLQLTGMTERESRAAAEKQELLVAELNHRVRNILGLIRSLVSQSRTSAADIDTFATILGDRVHSLARAHDQITAKNWGPGSLATLISTEAEAFLGEGALRLHADGPSIKLQPQAFSTVALVIHELMTNAVKHGALRDVTGRISITWKLDAMGSLTLNWNEAGGPLVAEPTKRGFGSTIILRSIPHELGGQASVDYAATGFRSQFILPSEHVVIDDDSEPALSNIRASETPARLSGLVLVVEDNFLIAMDAEDVLIGLGAERVVIASNIKEALEIIDLETPSFALLDINLGRETSWQIAARLLSLGVHHVFATGYGDGIDYPVEHRSTAVITKPYTTGSIAQAFRTAANV